MDILYQCCIHEYICFTTNVDDLRITQGSINISLPSSVWFSTVLVAEILKETICYSRASVPQILRLTCLNLGQKRIQSQGGAIPCWRTRPAAACPFGTLGSGKLAAVVGLFISFASLLGLTPIRSPNICCCPFVESQQLKASMPHWENLASWEETESTSENTHYQALSCFSCWKPTKTERLLSNCPNEPFLNLLLFERLSSVLTCFNK